jgi:hypothetical protein
MHKTHTRFLAAVTALLIPCTAMAAVMLDVSDSVAGVGLTVDMSGAKPAESVDIVVTDPDGYDTVIPVLADNGGQAVAMVPGAKAQTAGTYTVGARQKGGVSTSVQAQVHPDSVDAAMSQITVRDPQISADGRDQAAVEVTLRQCPRGTSCLADRQPQERHRHGSDAGHRRHRYAGILRPRDRERRHHAARHRSAEHRHTG